MQGFYRMGTNILGLILFIRTGNDGPAICIVSSELSAGGIEM
jgi:hypothetical protein